MTHQTLIEAVEALKEDSDIPWFLGYNRGIQDAVIKIRQHESSALPVPVEASFRSIRYWANAATEAETLEDAKFYAENARNHAGNALTALQQKDDSNG